MQQRRRWHYRCNYNLMMTTMALMPSRRRPIVVDDDDRLLQYIYLMCRWINNATRATMTLEWYWRQLMVVKSI